MLWLDSDVSRSLTQVGLGIGLSATVYGLSNFHLRSLFSYFFLAPPSNSQQYQLDFAPTEIGWLDRAFFLVFGVLNKTVRGLFGSRLDVRGKEEIVLPKLDITCPVNLGEDHNELYNAALTQNKDNGAKL